MSLSHGQVASCSRLPMRLTGPVSPITCAGRSWSVRGVGRMCPPAVVKLRSLLACQRMGPTLRLTGCEDWPGPRGMSRSVGADPRAWHLPQRARVPVEATLWVCYLWGQSGGALLWSDARLQVCGFSGLRRGSHAGQSELLLVTVRATWRLVAARGGPGGKWERPHCD